MATRDIEFSEEWVGTVDCDLDPGEPQRWYDSNGDPGTPGIPPSVEVYVKRQRRQRNRGRCTTILARSWHC